MCVCRKQVICTLHVAVIQPCVIYCITVSNYSRCYLPYHVDCPELTTLLLGLNRELVTISGEFFQSMPRLLVLDLSYNTSFSGLPEQISSLVSLRHLDLFGTMIKRLHVQELKMLIYLNLEWTSELEHLQGLSKLSNLRTLKQRESKLLLDMSHMKELHLLEHLEFISITVSSSLAEQLLYDPKIGTCIQQVSIRERPEESVSVLTLPAVDDLRGLDMRKCGMQEIKIEKTPWNKSFLNLSDVFIATCDGFKDLTWLLFAPNLTCLRVFNSNQLEDIINEEKAAIVLKKEDESCDIVPFQNLRILCLSDLPQLKTIYPNALPFECLHRLYADNCPKLRKLPLDSKSVLKVEEFTLLYNEELIERVEWEDEATRQRFLPSYKLI